MSKLKFELERLETRLASQARHQMDAPCIAPAVAVRGPRLLPRERRRAMLCAPHQTKSNQIKPDQTNLMTSDQTAKCGEVVSKWDLTAFNAF
jgi:hypothetical protein